MKKTFIAGSVVIALALASCNQKAEAPKAVAGEVKGQVIAYVDMDSLEAHFDFFKEKKAAIEKSQRDMESALQRDGEAFQREVIDFQQKAQYMTQTEGEAAQQRLMNKKDALERKGQQMQESLLAETQKFNKELTEKLDSFILTYNADKRYAYILSYAKGGSILYKDETYDITADVVKGLNEKYPTTKK